MVISGLRLKDLEWTIKVKIDRLLWCFRCTREECRSYEGECCQ